ncbi:protease modulator HflC [Oceanospirillum linum]|uniref:Protein HflC n=1 Tax=Oceanospirillum linum TaxID=966 RepID=A0A1T1H962_OCELI|nr:protease modulator HflC [Oceanospirillum linum]OOV86409.1 HflC protein [Oceanospirillum linum]SEG32548.1 protease FtsH subunit HflC [Oleiphilus messinensis]SMP28748.1 protease FtsH subunit HflC [Oceanospirillum linum]
MQSKSFPALILIAILALVGSNSLYIVNETERAIKLKFGEIIDSDIKPGLHFKLPVLHTIRKFDARILTMDSRPQRYLTLEKKAVIVDSFIKWRIADVQQYYEATSGDELVAARLLAPRMDEGLRNQFGERTMYEVISGERDELMDELTVRLNTITQDELGIEIRDIRVKRIDLPPEVSHAVFERMNTERQREAREHRSEGKEIAEGIRADADRQRQVVLAEAFRESERIRGEGDAIAAATYANAYTKNPEFYSFIRSLEAYRNSFSSKSDVMVLKPESEFFNYMKKSQ